MRTVEVFFDYECPYCKKGYEDFMELVQEHDDIDIVWKPCEAHPRPEEHPPHTDLCIQGYFLAVDKGIDILKFHERMFSAVHVDRIDVENPEVLVDYVKDLLDPEEYLEALRSEKYKEVQERNNIIAYEENEVWFLPAFRMDGKKLDAQGGIGVSRDEIIEFLKD